MSLRIDLKIEGMECPNCSMILERIEDKLPGVIFAEASYRKSNLIVEFDKMQINESQIRMEIQKMGYQVVESRPVK